MSNTSKVYNNDGDNLVVAAGGSIDTAHGAHKSNGIALSETKWVDVTCAATVLDASTGTGKVTVIAAGTGANATDQYKVRDARLVGGGTNFGSGGDRLLSLTDGTTVWTTIANADLETAPAATLAWGNAKVPFLTGTSDTASAAGAQIYFQYSGGTPATPHTTGSIKFSVCLEKVA
ncbi:MAG: hypothetical protein J0I75_15625 [Hyphomicrobium sp.]|nr:hypothetical protein [Hyphomicrobium sp.]